jgi:hypothetical protein
MEDTVRTLSIFPGFSGFGSAVGNPQNPGNKASTRTTYRETFIVVTTVRP